MAANPKYSEYHNDDFNNKRQQLKRIAMQHVQLHSLIVLLDLFKDSGLLNITSTQNCGPFI